MTEPKSDKTDAFSMFILICGLAIAAFIILALAMGSNLPDKKDSAPDVDPEATAALIEKLTAPPSWSYADLPDPISGKTGKAACITSSNTVKQDFPYEETSAMLCVRKGARDALDAYVRLVSGGQFTVNSYSHSKVMVRIDKKPAAAYSVIGAADYSTDVFFFTNAARLQSALIGSEKTFVEVQLYQAGNQVLEFNTSGFAPVSK